MKRILMLFAVVMLLYAISVAGDGTDWLNSPPSKYGDWQLLKYSMMLDSNLAAHIDDDTTKYFRVVDTIQTLWRYIGTDKTEFLARFDVTSACTTAKIDSVDSFVAIIQTRTDTAGTTGIYNIGYFGACTDTCSKTHYFRRDSLVVYPLGCDLRLLVTYTAWVETTRVRAADTLSPFLGYPPCSLEVRFRAFE